MNGQHAIDELVLDLSFSSSRLTRHEQAELADWVSQEFLPQLDKLFSVYSAGSQVLQFESIKLDLGWLPARYYRQEIVRQTCAQLEFLIAQASLQIASSPNLTDKATNQGINLYQQQLEQLLVFLRTGQLPFHRDNANSLVSQRVHEQLLEKVLDKHNLLAVLRALPQREELLKRLVNQFSSRHLTELLRQIAPEQFATIQALLDLWELAQSPLPTLVQINQANDSPVALPPVKSLWSIILELFIHQDYISQPAARWLIPVLEKIQQQYKITPVAIAKRLLIHGAVQQSHIEQSKDHQSLRNELRGLIRNSASPLISGKQQLSLFAEKAERQTSDTSRENIPSIRNTSQSPVRTTAIDLQSGDQESSPDVSLSLWLRRWLHKLSTELNYSSEASMASFVRAQLLTQASLYLSQLQQILLDAFIENPYRSYADTIEFVEFIESLSREPAILHEPSIIQTLVKAAHSYTASSSINYAGTPEEDTSLGKLNSQQYSVIAGPSNLKNWFRHLLSQERDRLYPAASTSSVTGTNRTFSENPLIATPDSNNPEKQDTDLAMENPLYDSAIPGATDSHQQNTSSTLEYPEGKTTFTITQAKNFLSSLFIKGDPSQLEYYWPILLAEHPGLVVQSLRHFLVQPEIRQQLMVNFPLLILIDMVELFSPVAQPGFTRLLENASLLMQDGTSTNSNIEAKSSQATSVAASIEWWQRQLWEIVLSTLIHQQSTTSGALYQAVIQTYADLNNLVAVDIKPFWEKIISGSRPTLDTEDIESDTQQKITQTADLSTSLVSAAETPSRIQEVRSDSINSLAPEITVRADHSFYIHQLQSFLTNSDTNLVLEPLLYDIKKLSVDAQTAIYRQLAQAVSPNTLRILSFGEWRVLLTHLLDLQPWQAIAKSQEEQWPDTVFAGIASQQKPSAELYALFQPLLMALLQANEFAVQKWIKSSHLIFQNTGTPGITTGGSEAHQAYAEKPLVESKESGDLLVDKPNNQLSANALSDKDGHENKTPAALLINQLQGALVNSLSTTNLIHSLKQLQGSSATDINNIFFALKQFIDTADDGDIALSHWKLLAEHLLEINEKLQYLSSSTRKQLAGILSPEPLAAGGSKNIDESTWSMLLNQLANEYTNARLFYKEMVQDLLAQTGKPLDSYLISRTTPSTPNIVPLNEDQAHEESIAGSREDSSLQVAQKELGSKTFPMESNASPAESKISPTELQSPSLLQKILRDAPLQEAGQQEKKKDTPEYIQAINALIELWHQHAGNPSSLQAQFTQWENLPPRQLQDFYKELGFSIEKNPGHTQTNWRLLLKHLLETYHKYLWIDFSFVSESVTSTTASVSLPALIISRVDDAATLVSDTKAFYKKLTLNLLKGNTSPLQQLWVQDKQSPLTSVLSMESPVDTTASAQATQEQSLTAKKVLLVATGENSSQDILEAIRQLKSGQLAWSGVPGKLDVLQQMVTTYIMESGAVTYSLQQDLLSAINQQAHSTEHKENYYRIVLGHLLAEKPLDLEDILQKLKTVPVTDDTVARGTSPDIVNITNIKSVQESSQPDSEVIDNTTSNAITNTTDSTSISTRTRESVVQNITAVKSQSNQQIVQATALLPGGTSPTADGLAMLAQELMNKNLPVNNITLPESQWFALVKQVIKENPVIANSFKQDILNAIQQHSPAAQHRTAYYRKILQQLLTNEILDVEAISAELAEQDVPTIQPTRILPPSANDKNQQQPVHLSTPDAQEFNNNAVPPDEHRFDPASLYLQIRAGKYQPLDSGLSIAQWRQLIGYIIGQNTQAPPEFRTELANAIEAQAPKAINLTNFYRHLVIALAEQKPLDLEALAIAPIIEHKTLAKQAAQKIPTNESGLTEVVPDLQGTSLSMADSTVLSQEDSPKALDLEIRDASQDQFDQLKQLLEQTSSLSHAQSIALQKIIQQILAGNSEQERAYWLPLLKQEAPTNRLIDYLPAHILHALFKHLFPGDYPALENMVKLLGEVLLLLIQEHNSPLIKKAKWQFIIGQLVAPAAGISKEDLFEQLGQAISLAVNLDEPQRLMNLLQRRIGLLKKPVPQTEGSFQLADLARNNAQDQAALEQGIHLNNVGMVLMAPFMPRLFSMLKLTDQGKFIHMAAAERGAHLLQYAVTGTTETPEYEMLLNKVLCGMNTSIPIADSFDITEEEKTIIEQLLQSMIQHWKILGSTSIAGLRQTFLLRQGWLSLEENHWQLKVQPGTFDMLLDQLPWTIALIKHGWMDKPLHVNWR